MSHRWHDLYYGEQRFWSILEVGRMDMAKHRQAEWEEWLVCRAALAQRVSQHVRCVVWHASDRPAPAGPGLAAFEASLPSFVATQPNRLGVLYCSYVQQVPAAALEALARLTGICALSFGQCEEEPVNAMLSALAGGLCHMDCIPWRASAVDATLALTQVTSLFISTALTEPLQQLTHLSRLRSLGIVCCNFDEEFVRMPEPASFPAGLTRFHFSSRGPQLEVGRASGFHQC